MRALRTVVLFAALATRAAAVPPSVEEWRDYSGQLDGRIPIRMTLRIQSDRRVSGSYFYVQSLRDIPIQGEVEADQTVVLHEYGEPGRVTGVFRGKFLGQDAIGRKLVYEQMEGCWAKPDGSGPRLFHLAQSSGRLRQPGENRYAVAGLKDDVAVERFAQGFVAAVLAGDRAKVAAAVHLPIVVRVGGWPIKVRHKEVLLARYAAIFHPTFLQSLARAVPHAMFARDTGVMLGEHGEVWMGGRDGALRVIAINN
ncbi:MAG TPA: hypothetical protein VGR07_08460 [Thermoanaerobaculia bacterium]|jgi:hypothetical protein|nr:hypothetical protein [Thermoanaerobaculia bacterium]